jgi:hypothetical protein
MQWFTAITQSLATYVGFRHTMCYYFTAVHRFSEPHSREFDVPQEDVAGEARGATCLLVRWSASLQVCRSAGLTMQVQRHLSVCWR